jgi:hypothetical protein
VTLKQLTLITKTELWLAKPVRLNPLPTAHDSEAKLPEMTIDEP